MEQFNVKSLPFAAMLTAGTEGLQLGVVEHEDPVRVQYQGVHMLVAVLLQGPCGLTTPKSCRDVGYLVKNRTRRSCVT